MNQIKIIPLITVLAIMLSSCSSPRPVRDFCSQWEIDRAIQNVMEGDTYVKNNEYEKCEMMYMTALDVFKNCSKPYYEANTYESIGNLAEYQGNVDLAISYYSKASELYHQLNFPNHAARLALEEKIALLQKGLRPEQKGLRPEIPREPTKGEPFQSPVRLEELLDALKNLEKRLIRLIEMEKNGDLDFTNR